MNDVTKPNVLLIMTDQQRWDTIHAGGNDYIETPNLDRLCSTGVRFDNAYSESPECVPARASVLTGRWGHDTGCLHNTTPLSEEVPTFVDSLSDSGYWTEAVGKMHFEPVRTSHGFKKIHLSEEIPESMEGDDFLQYLKSVGYGNVHEPHGVRHEYYYVPQVSQLPNAHHNTTWVGDKTVEFLNKKKRDPWFFFTSFIKPHPPFDATIPYLNMYNHEELPLPSRSEEEKKHLFDLLNWQTYTKWMESVDDNLTRLIKANYYACITQLDTQIGRILDVLESTGQRDNTLIIFMSDHGELLGDHFQWGKRCFYNGAMRIPLILSWPTRIPQGEVRDQFASLIDIAPTILNTCGLVEQSNKLPGDNIVEFALNKEVSGRKIAFGEFGVKEKAIYMAWDGDWKYIYTPNGSKEGLYYLPEDPNELKNLASDNKVLNKKMHLKNELIKFFKKENYDEALSDDKYDLLSLPETNIPDWRNRQYAKWTDVQVKYNATDIYASKN
ncbi:sulfatase [Radiobacillus sp. PE A8.2]|uniref:sulfatase family protein n=1 Tax=Radiobacillus sp. PE A8.2 TaxID=3380349 RepID=UPI00388F61F9